MGRDPATPTEDLAGWETQLRKGALSLAVLAILWRERLYGLEILKRLDADGGLSISEGAIYPLLNRMKAEGLVAAEWVEADAGHPRKYYSLTAAGRRRARDLAAGWRAFAAGLGRLLTPMDGDLS